MSILEKILNKSNSYKYYKNQYEKLVKKNQRNENEIKKLKMKLNKKDVEIKNYKKDISFLRQELIEKDNKIRYLKH